MLTWSFTDVTASITGPGGTYSMGAGNGNAQEGITTTMTEDKDTLTWGASGELMHSLHAAQPGRIQVRLLRTSPLNHFLSALFNFQRLSSANWGQNSINVSNLVTGDNVVAAQMGFVKHPDVPFATEGGVVEWEFSGLVVIEMGAGTSALGGIAA